MKYFAIGDEETLLGLSLVGVEGKIVKTAEDVKAAFNEVIQDKTIGIILINEKFAQKSKDFIEEFIYTKSFPLIIEIPDRNGPLPGRKAVDEIIRDSVGVRI
ncbi:MAG: V-type ATP synthase subunit F [Spirochaetes bacterium]|nr:V-type ATP synthase subunit F [Spirochaetota bacterium]